MKKVLFALVALSMSFVACKKSQSESPRRCWRCTITKSYVLYSGPVTDVAVDSICDKTAAELTEYNEKRIAEYQSGGKVTAYITCQ